jgi:diguanylate cyclase (GGDEF)-like protein
MQTPRLYTVLWRLEILVGRGRTSNALCRALSRALYRLRFRLFLHDFLTGLLTRQALQRRVNRSLAGGKLGALLVVDADRFKSVNDRWGPKEGDDCLRHLAVMIRESVAGRLSGRLGGDEFAVYTDLASEAHGLAERICGRVERDQRFSRLRVELASPHAETASSVLTVTVGVAYSKSGQTFADLVREADMALSIGKSEGRNRIAVFGKR